METRKARTKAEFTRTAFCVKTLRLCGQGRQMIRPTTSGNTYFGAVRSQNKYPARQRDSLSQNTVRQYHDAMQCKNEKCSLCKSSLWVYNRGHGSVCHGLWHILIASWLCQFFFSSFEILSLHETGDDLWLHTQVLYAGRLHRYTV
jgi:hypothetical protein